MEDREMTKTSTRDRLPEEGAWPATQKEKTPPAHAGSSSLLISVLTALAVGFLIWMLLKGPALG